MKASILARKIKRKILGMPPMCASFLIAMPPFETMIEKAYNKKKEEHKCQLPDLCECDQKIVAELELKGVCITSIDALGLPGTEDMLAIGQQLGRKYEQLDKQGHFNGRDAFQAGADDVLSNRKLFYWGLNERLLKIAEVYLGMPVAYDGLNLFYTKVDGRQVAARKWHRDGEDRRIVKVAVYFNDVDEGGGALQILNPELPGHKFVSKFRPPVFRHEALEAEFGRPLDASDITTCTGPTGTVIFTDTAVKYHRGKPAVTRPRCAVFFNYFTRVPLRPFFCERSTLSRAQIKSLDDGLTPLQRSALLWRDSLPLISRIIPPEPIA